MATGKDIAILVGSFLAFAGVIVFIDYMLVTQAAKENPFMCIKGTFFEGNSEICRLNEFVQKILPFLGLFG